MTDTKALAEAIDALYLATARKHPQQMEAYIRDFRQLQTVLQAARFALLVLEGMPGLTAMRVTYDGIQGPTVEAHDMNVAEGLPDNDPTITCVDAAIALQTIDSVLSAYGKVYEGAE